jgi:hypothetical protein
MRDDGERREHCRDLAIAHHVSEHVQFADHEEPVATTRAGYLELGHEARPVLDAIREKCIDCSGGSQSEVKLCRSMACALYPFRMRKNPWRTEQSVEQREAAGRRLIAARNRLNGNGFSDDDESAATHVAATEHEGVF